MRPLATGHKIQAFMCQPLKYANPPKFYSFKQVYVYNLCVRACMWVESGRLPPCRLTEHLRVEEASCWLHSHHMQDYRIDKSLVLIALENQSTPLRILGVLAKLVQ